MTGNQSHNPQDQALLDFLAAQPAAVLAAEAGPASLPACSG